MASKAEKDGHSDFYSAYKTVVESLCRSRPCNADIIAAQSDRYVRSRLHGLSEAEIRDLASAAVAEQEVLAKHAVEAYIAWNTATSAARKLNSLKVESARLRRTSSSGSAAADSEERRGELGITLANAGDGVLTFARIHVRVQTDGRVLPWSVDTLNMDLPGGLEPGERRIVQIPLTWVRGLNITHGSQLLAVDAPGDAVVRTDILQIVYASGETLSAEGVDVRASEASLRNACSEVRSGPLPARQPSACVAMRIREFRNRDGRSGTVGQ